MNSQALEQLFENNRTWAEGMVSKDADFFKRLASLQIAAFRANDIVKQAPEYLWIG